MIFANTFGFIDEALSEVWSDLGVDMQKVP